MPNRREEYGIKQHLASKSKGHPSTSTAAVTGDDEPSTAKGRHLITKRRLPPTGVVDGASGFPFYHLTVTQLTAAMWKRLEDCGITISTARFSPLEDRRLRKNWRRYARHNRIAYEDAPLYCGTDNASMDKDLRLRIRRLRNATHFLPQMCRKLDDRIGKQVYRRLAYLFDPAVMEVGRRPWTDEDDLLLAKLAKRYGADFVKIGGLMERPAFDVNQRHTFSISVKKGPFTVAEWRKLADLVIGELKADCPETAVGITDYEDLVDWVKVARQMQRARTSCVRNWSSIRSDAMRRLTSGGNGACGSASVLDLACLALGSTPEQAAQLENGQIRRRVVMPAKKMSELLMAIRGQNPRTLDDINFERLAQLNIDPSLDTANQCRFCFVNIRFKHREIFFERGAQALPDLSACIDQLFLSKKHYGNFAHVPGCKCRIHRQPKTTTTRRTTRDNDNGVGGDDDDIVVAPSAAPQNASRPNGVAPESETPLDSVDYYYENQANGELLSKVKKEISTT